MLRRVSIRDFVIVEHSVLDFEAGFTVLTGETGAGKSILIDALGLVLGERGDAAMVRAGAKQAEVSAEFEIGAQPTIAEWLVEAALEGDPDVCLLRRTLEPGGRSRAFINGHSATIAQLRQLGEMLVDIHGQHAHQSLLRPASQRDLLDDYAGCAQAAAEAADQFRYWAQLSARLESAKSDAERLAREREQLSWQVDELTQLDFTLPAWGELNAEHARLGHAASLIEAASSSIETLGEGDAAAASLVAATAARITRAAEIDATLAPVLEVLQGAQIQIDEALHALERYRSRLEIDPVRLAQIETRIQSVHDACRKYRLTPQELEPALQAAQARLSDLELDLDLSRLEREISDAQAAYRDVATQLSAARRKAAVKLGRQVSTAMQELALAGGRFEVTLETLAEPTAHGYERIEFRVAAHAAIEPGALARVASGGELSRLSLAIQSVLSEVARVPTLIFDEVDVGIGGRVAEIVGHMLHRLGTRHQVMCVTHLAQVAACADRHWSVAKDAQAGAASSRVEALDAEQRVDEIARMLGGVKITRATRAHAAELLHEAARRAGAS